MEPNCPDPSPSFPRAFGHAWLHLIENVVTGRALQQPGPGPWITRQDLALLSHMRCNATLPTDAIGPRLKLQNLQPSRTSDDTLNLRYDTCMEAVTDARETIARKELRTPLPATFLLGQPRVTSFGSRGQPSVVDMVAMRGMRRKEWFQAAFDAAAISYNQVHATKQKRVPWGPGWAFGYPSLCSQQTTD